MHVLIDSTPLLVWTAKLVKKFQAVAQKVQSREQLCDKCDASPGMTFALSP